MNGRPGVSSEALRVLLDCERVVPPLSSSTRARAMARARSAGALPAFPLPAPVGLVSRWVLRIALGGLTLAAGVVIGHLAASRPQAAVARPIAQDAPLVAPAPAREIARPSATETAAPVATAPSREDATRAPAPSPGELALLQRARAAIARSDFAAAMPVIDEHARRFRSGSLAEEREALRVRALAGLGRTEDARRAAVAFRERFPSSVLLHAVAAIAEQDHGT